MSPYQTARLAMVLTDERARLQPTTPLRHLSTDERAHPQATRKFLLALVTALLAVVLGGVFVSTARAEDPLLPPAGTCAGENNSAIDWGNVDAQRAAVACLINQVRARAGVPQLRYCTTSVSCNYTYTGTSPLLAHANAFALYTAAQWKAMDVDYGIDETSGYGSPCSPPNNGAMGLRLDILQQFGLPQIPRTGENIGTLAYTYAIPHYACSRPVTWWDDVVTRVYRTPNVGTNFKENLAPGFRQVNGVNYYSTPRAVVNMWMNEVAPNDGHRQAILDPTMVLLGVGASPAWYGNIAAAPIKIDLSTGNNIGGLNWGTYRQVYSAQFIR